MGCCCHCCDEVEFVKAELGIPMHCQACEKTVVNALFKTEGVESVKSSFSTQKVVVTGRIDLSKLAKRIKRKTGKTVEVVEVIDGDDGDTHSVVGEVPAFVHHCGCHLCQPSYHGYFMPGYTYNRMGLNHGVPIQENDYSYCSIM